MNKEELKKEAEDWIGDYTSVPCSCMFLKYDYTNLVEAYLAGAEPREKRIVELEAQIEKMKQERSAKVKQRVINEIVSAIEKDREERR